MITGGFLICTLLLSVHSTYLELCCSYSSQQQDAIGILTHTLDSFNLKLIIGCSQRPKVPCQCFSANCDIEATIIANSKKERFTINNDNPDVLFDGIMRNIHPSLSRNKSTNHIYICPGYNMSPLLWKAIIDQSYTWSHKKSCLTPDSLVELLLPTKTIISLSVFNQAAAHAFSSRHEDKDAVNDMPETKAVDLELYSGSILSQNEAVDKTPKHFNLKFKDNNGKYSIRMEESVLETEYFTCKTSIYHECIQLLKAMKSFSEMHNTIFHLPPKITDFFLSTAATPSVLFVYKPGEFQTTQQLAIKVDSSLSQSLVGYNNSSFSCQYSVAMVEINKLSPFKVTGAYLSLRPRSPTLCDTDVFHCIGTSLHVILPKPKTVLANITRVFGDDKLSDDALAHRGNLNDPSFFKMDKEASRLLDIREKLLLLNSNSGLRTDDGLGLIKVLDSGLYKEVKHSKRGEFIMFVYRSDLRSLDTVQQLINNNIRSLYLAECFNLNVICDELQINSYPTILFMYNNTNIPYHGTVSVEKLDAFREFRNFPALAKVQKIQIDFILANKENPAAVLITRNPTRVAVFRNVCGELHGYIKCFHLEHNNKLNTGEDLIIAHVPTDPVMINKKITYKKLEDMIHNLPGNDYNAKFSIILKKLSVPSAITDHQYLSEFSEYENVSEFLVFDGAIDDRLKEVILRYPLVQFIQLTTPEVKHSLLVRLLNMNINDIVLFIDRFKGVYYHYKNDMYINEWLGLIKHGKVEGEAILEEPINPKVKYENILYRNRFFVYSNEVQKYKLRIEELHNLSKYDHNEL